jgi:hypothetical protein
MQSKIDFRKAIKAKMQQHDLTGHALDRRAGVTRGTTTAYLGGRDAGIEIVGKLLAGAGVKVVPGGNPTHLQAILIKQAQKQAGENYAAAGKLLGISRPFASLFLRGVRGCRASLAERMLERLGCSLVV